MSWYSDKIDSKYFNLSIDGLDLIGEDLNPNESYNRRETSRKYVIGGTQQVIRTNYIHRDFSLVCYVPIDPAYPDIYDSTFRLWQSKPVEVISKEMGGKFDAECIIKKKHESPAYLTLEIQLIEIPSETSLIPNDSVTIPTDKITTTVTSKSNKATSKTEKKTTAKSTNTTSKNKGNNITKVA